MPQGRRKIPFSGKAKKAQMKAKKDRQQSDNTSFQQPEVPDETGTGAEIKETAGTDVSVKSSIKLCRCIGIFYLLYVLISDNASSDRQCKFWFIRVVESSVLEIGSTTI